MAQSVKHPTLDLSSGLDLRVVSSSPALGSMMGVKPTFKKRKEKKIGKRKKTNMGECSSEGKRRGKSCMKSPYY